MTAQIVQFPMRQKPKFTQSADTVVVITLRNAETGEQIKAVNEEGAAIKLNMTLEAFRRQQPVPAIPDTGDERLYSVTDVAHEMWRRKIPVGVIE